MPRFKLSEPIVKSCPKGVPYFSFEAIDTHSNTVLGTLVSKDSLTHRYTVYVNRGGVEIGLKRTDLESSLKFLKGESHFWGRLCNTLLLKWLRYNWPDLIVKEK